MSDAAPDPARSPGRAPGPRPLVAIVGRANVGKSTLFNRLLRERRALVEDRPGVTRDRVAAPARIEGREVLLVDTGGLDPDAESGIPARVAEQVRRVLADAALVLLVVDARDGLLPLDREVAGLLRRAGVPVLVAANKADAPRLDEEAREFHALGFEPVIPVSAEHRRGLVDLELAIAEHLPERAAEPASDGDEALRIAIVGRPNVGKSSLVNRLIGEERQIVADEPGTTRDATDTRLRVGEHEVVLIDTAGLRRPGRRVERLERGSAYQALRSIERADLACVLIDVVEGVTDQDAKVARLALDLGRPLLLVCNKWDAVDASERRPELEAQLERKLGFVPEAEVVHLSAKTGEGSEALLPRALALYEALRRRIATPEINRVLQEAIDRNAPPASGRRRARFYYGTQISDAPLTIAVFMNDPALLPENYRRYLEGVFRKRFAIKSAPVRLQLRPRGRRARGGEEEGGAIRNR